jgi:hypothetical protein
MIRCVLRSLLPALLLFVLVPVPCAGDEADTPAARWKKVAAGFAAPSAEKGFEWAVEFTVPGMTIGTGRLSAVPGKEGESAVWTTENVMELQQGMTARMTEVVAKNLESLRGESHKQAPDGEKRLRWVKEDGGSYGVRIQKGETETVEGKVDGQGRLTVGLASGLLALRMLPAEAADYETLALDDDAPSADKLSEKVVIAVKGVQKWSFQGKERDAWITEVRRGEQVLRIALDPSTRDLLAIEAVGQQFAIVPKSQAEPSDEKETDLSKPAKTAQMAAAKAAIGFASGVKELVAAAIHWPSALAAAREVAVAAGEDEKKDDETLKQEILDSLQVHAPRELVEPMVLGMVATLPAKKMENGHTLVTFPEAFRSMAFETAEIDGVWYVVKFPTPPDQGGDEDDDDDEDDDEE